MRNMDTTFQCAQNDVDKVKEKRKMSLTASEMTPADIAAVTDNRGGYGDGFGGNGIWQVLPLYTVTCIEKLRY